jgi:hypothetical protein
MIEEDDAALLKGGRALTLQDTDFWASATRQLHFQ